VPPAPLTSTASSLRPDYDKNPQDTHSLMESYIGLEILSGYRKTVQSDMRKEWH